MSEKSLDGAAKEGEDLCQTFFAWKGVSLTVPSGKQILHDLEGIVHCGELCFIMGPSGAGKSTFLDVLADRVKADNTVGRIYVPEGTAEARSLAYVQQHDALPAVLTARQVRGMRSALVSALACSLAVFGILILLCWNLQR